MIHGQVPADDLVIWWIGDLPKKQQQKTEQKKTQVLTMAHIGT